MKTESLSISEKSELFSKAHPMHDCSFIASFEQNTLVLTFDNLQNYFDTPPVTYWFDGYHKLTIKYHNTEFVNLSLKYGKKEKDFYDTVDPLNGKELIMFGYSVDCFNQMTLDFYVKIKKNFGAARWKLLPTK